MQRGKVTRVQTNKTTMSRKKLVPNMYSVFVMYSICFSFEKIYICEWAYSLYCKKTVFL